MRHQQEVQQHGKNGKHACSKFLLPLSRAGLARMARTVSFEKGSAMRRRRWVGGAAESTEIWKPFALKTSDQTGGGGSTGDASEDGNSRAWKAATATAGRAYEASG